MHVCGYVYFIVQCILWPKQIVLLGSNTCFTMERRAKLQKLNQFRRKLPHITASALAAVLGAVRDDGLPDLADRDSMREARDLESMAPGPYGPILQHVDAHTKDGHTKQVPIPNPFCLYFGL